MSIETLHSKTRVTCACGEAGPWKYHAIDARDAARWLGWYVVQELAICPKCKFKKEGE